MTKQIIEEYDLIKKKYRNAWFSFTDEECIVIKEPYLSNIPTQKRMLIRTQSGEYDPDISLVFPSEKDYIEYKIKELNERLNYYKKKLKNNGTPTKN